MRPILCVAAAIALAGCHSTTVVEDNFFATWEIDSVSVGAVTCEEVGAVTVDMDVLNTDTGERQIFTFACNAYQGTSGEIGVGTFDVIMSLNDGAGASLSQTRVGTENLSVAGTIDLGHHIFQVP